MRDQDIIIHIGEDVSQPLVVYEATGGVRDLTGHSVTWALTEYWSEAVVLTAAPSISDAGTGEVLLTLARAGTAELASGVYRHEFRVTDTAGNESVVAVGAVTALYSSTGEAA